MINYSDVFVIKGFTVQNFKPLIFHTMNSPRPNSQGSKDIVMVDISPKHILLIFLKENLVKCPNQNLLIFFEKNMVVNQNLSLF